MYFSMMLPLPPTMPLILPRRLLFYARHYFSAFFIIFTPTLFADIFAIIFR